MKPRDKTGRNHFRSRIHPQRGRALCANDTAGGDCASQKYPDDAWGTLNLPRAGHIFCGKAASDRFSVLARRTLKPRSDEAKSFHERDYVRALRDAFVELLVVSRATAGEGWYEHHTQGAEHLWRPLADAVQTLTSGVEPDELNQRLLDALNWFGQAVQETSTAAALVKYAAALERLTMTSHVEKGIQELVTRRVVMLNQSRSEKQLNQIRQEVLDLYECRSGLMHGSISPADPRVRRLRRVAWEVTRWSIFEMAQLFALIRSTGPANRKRLGAAYDGGRVNTTGEARGA